MLRGPERCARERQCLAQNRKIADVIGENQDERGVELSALLVGEPPMGFDDEPISGVGIGKTRSGVERHGKA